MVARAYGPPEVLELRDVPIPEPRAGEIRVRVHAATVTAGDCEVRASRHPWWIRLPLRLVLGIRRPRRGIFGQELAGVVDAVGADVERFRPGDPVFAITGPAMGAYADAVCLRADGPVARVPDGLGLEEAAAIPVGGLTALHLLRKAEIRPGETLLVNGAGGSIGTFAVQLAKRAGAEVTAVDRAEKLAMLRSIGADHVLDHTREDVLARGEAYDVILDVVGSSTFASSERALREGGRWLTANPTLGQLLRGEWASRRGGRRAFARLAGESAEDLARLGERVAAGELRAVIDRRYPLEELAEAHRYVDAGHKQGNVVILVADGG